MSAVVASHHFINFIPNSVSIKYLENLFLLLKSQLKKLCSTCNRLFSCKSNLNRHAKSCHCDERQQEKKESKKRYYTLKLCVTAKKSDHEIKTILKDAVILLKINM